MSVERWSVQAQVGYDLIRTRVTRSLRNGRLPDRPVILNSLPKSGTHLGIKLLESLPGLGRVRVPLRNLTADLFPASDRGIAVGVASPASADRDRLMGWLARVPPGAFVAAHVPYTNEFSELLSGLGYRMVLVLRDPRDVAVSSAAHLFSRSQHTLQKTFSVMSPDDRLLASINGIVADAGELRDLRARVQSMTAWMSESYTVTVRFEDLVGPAGGGDASLQAASIASVADHIGVTLTDSEIEAIGQSLFGGTATFRQGRIGGWGSEFGQVHRSAAGPLIQDILVDLGYEDDDAWWRGDEGTPSFR